MVNGQVFKRALEGPMKKKAKKQKGSRGHSKQMSAPMMDFKPKPFSAHFHAEGSTMDELQKSLSDQVGPHIKKARKVKTKAKHSRSVGRVLST